MQIPSILESTRVAVGLEQLDDSFDEELISYINNALGTLRQNGVGLSIIVTNVAQEWDSIKDPLHTIGDDYFEMVKLFVFTKTKLIFDPPPPSNVAYYKEYIDEILWRLKSAYEGYYESL